MAHAANSWAQKQQKKQEQKSEGEEHGKLYTHVQSLLEDIANSV